MRVHKLNNVEQAMDLLEKHKVYLVVYIRGVAGGGGRGWKEGLIEGGGYVWKLNLRYEMEWGWRLSQLISFVLYCFSSCI